MNKLPIIGFEGLDGVGKTTAARNFAEFFGAVIVTQRDLMPVWKDHRKEVNAGTDVEARFNYFWALNRRQLQLAQAVQRSGRLAVLESTTYRTFATHRVLGSKTAKDTAIEQADLPDLTIQLYVPENERERHLVSRDGSLTYSSHWDETLHSYAKELNQAYDSFDLTRIDTRKPKLAVASQAIKIVRQHGFEL